MIVGIDWGNSEIKRMSENGLDKFPSDIGEYWDRNLVNAHGTDDITFEHEGRRGFAGTLAIESDFAGSIMGDTKSHEDALLRLLLALHRCGTSPIYDVVVGQPISKHTQDEKDAIKRMVIGQHDITVNGIERSFVIRNCEVAAEGGAAFWSAPVDGLVRIIDTGSATVNCASFINKRYFNRDSFTLDFGINTVRTNDKNELARGIYTKTSKRWKNDDNILLVGGAAESLLNPIKKYYENASIIKPMIRDNSSLKTVKPIFANAVGFYNIGRAIYE